MTVAQILIPFALPPAEHAKDLIALLKSTCHKNGLATLLARHQKLTLQRFDDFNLQLPHEIWLNNYLKEQQLQSYVEHVANQFGVTLQQPKQDTKNAACWFILTPVNYHIAISHLVLTDYRGLQLNEEQAHQLFVIAQQCAAEIGLELVYGSPYFWFLRADDWADFATASPDAACGHNIEIWSPKGEHEMVWRKLQNEIQMTWFMHPIQEQRAHIGMPPINGIWCGQKAVLQNHDNRAALLDFAPANTLNFQAPLTLIDTLTTSALSSDWSYWAEAFKELDNNWFIPLVEQLKSRKISASRLHLSNTNRLMSIDLSRAALYQFWRAASLNALKT